MLDIRSTLDLRLFCETDFWYLWEVFLHRKLRVWKYELYFRKYELYFREYKLYFWKYTYLLLKIYLSTLSLFWRKKIIEQIRTLFTYFTGLPLIFGAQGTIVVTRGSKIDLQAGDYNISVQISAGTVASFTLDFILHVGKYAKFFFLILFKADNLLFITTLI